jgi:hypothetical protein
MARYYFHVKQGDRLLEDPEGVDLPDPDEARALALKSARELWAETIKAGHDLPADAFVIEDERGQSLFVPLTEALPKRLRG